MGKFYVPYSGKKPASILVNGHRLIILSRDEDVFEYELRELGADSLKKVLTGDSREEEERILNKLAKAVAAGVVVAPANLHVSEVIKNLESQLPWLQ